MSLASQSQVDETAADRNEPTFTCDECCDDPTTTSTGVCSVCRSGVCRECDGEGEVETMIDVDRSRITPCSSCRDVEIDDDDSRYDAMRDDRLTESRDERNDDDDRL